MYTGLRPRTSGKAASTKTEATRRWKEKFVASSVRPICSRSVTVIYLSAPDVRGPERETILATIDPNWCARVGPDRDAFDAEVGAR
jgi:hypothetical protein